MKQILLKQFANPSNEFRGKPFWAWNGKLEEGELRRQIRIMRRMGLGGFFMHSRVGLATPYLSDEWFKLVNACADEAEKHGLEAWLYDEDRWPSGAAGGLVTRNPKYRMQSLVMECISKPSAFKWSANTVAAFTARVEGSTAKHVRKLKKGQRVQCLLSGETILTFCVEKSDCTPGYNGYTYLDTMSHEAVKEFINVTHEAYRKNAGGHFAKTIPGIFTDEPYYGNVLVGGALPWTSNLLSTFRIRYGYNLIPHLPELYFDLEDCEISQPRYHYHDCITFMFTDAFARQIGQWCKRNKLLFTGHVLLEQTLSSQTSVVGSCMRFYEYMQAPGMDILTEYWREYETAKQVSSVARQFGRKWRLTETYGCTGWDFPFAAHKALGNWQVALGINLRCPHLSWYTMQGQAKRDYPASIFFQSPWWELYPKVEDYFARIHVVMTQGEEVRDLLVIHPVESMWTMAKTGWIHEKRTLAYDSMLMAIRDSMLTEHIDFDYGDEDILARHAKLKRKNGQPVLSVGKAIYKAVLVPPLKTMRKSTLAILKKFQAAGGLVVFAGKPASYVDALPKESVAEFAAKCSRVPVRGKALVSSLEKTCRRLSITDQAGKEISAVLYLLREDKNAFYLFICNTGYKKGQIRPSINEPPVRNRKEEFPCVLISGFSECNGKPVELDPDTGAITTASSSRVNGQLMIRTSLPKLGSRLFIIMKKAGGKRFPAKKTFSEARRIKLNKKRWPVIISEFNNVVLDRPTYRVGTGKWKVAQEVLRVDEIIRDKIGIPRRGGDTVQPWARKEQRCAKNARIELAYSINISHLPGGSLFLAMEQPERYCITFNGKELTSDAECGWWVDPSLRNIPVDTGLLRLGHNEIRMACNYDEKHPGLEIIYLLGAFGVELKGSIPVVTSMPATLKLGDWCSQGLPFYSGSVSYMCTIAPKLRKGERLFLNVPSYRGAAVRVLVNGRDAGVIAWEPNEKDITDFLTEKMNELRIEVVGHRRNSHGPLHTSEKWPVWVGPGQFVTKGKAWTDSFQLVPIGLMEPPQLIIRKKKLATGNR